LVSGGVLLCDFLPRLDAAFDAADIACVLIASPEGAGDEALSAIAKPLIEVVQQRDAAALIGGRPELAKQLQADGVHLDLRDQEPNDGLRLYRHIRKTLGDDAIVGALCPAERHAAMELAEAGAEYVGFDAAAPEARETIAWWGEMMTVPCIAFNTTDIGMARVLAASGADFIAPDRTLWNGDDPIGAIGAFMAALR
jgi:thiamine-phosphate pyrophosphorylase